MTKITASQRSYKLTSVVKVFAINVVISNI